MLQGMLKKRLAALCVVLMGLLAMAMPQLAQAEVPTSALDAVPAGAQIVFVVPNLQEMSDSVARVNTELGIHSPEMSDVLGMMKMQGGIEHGLDDTGSMLVVLPNVTSLFMGGGNEPPILMMIPVTDYAAFVGNFGATPDENGNADFVMPDGTPFYAKSQGDYAIMSPMQMMIMGYTPGNNAAGLLEKIGSQGESALGNSDVTILVDVETLAPMVMPMIDMGLMAATMEMQQMAEQDPTAKQALVAMQGFSQAVKATMSSLRGLSISIHDSENGLVMDWGAALVPDSALAKVLPGGEVDPAALIAQLPAEMALLTAAMDMEAINMKYIVESMQPMMQADPMLSKLYGDMLPLMENLTDTAVAWYAPANVDDPSSMYRTITVTSSTQPEQSLTALNQYMLSLDGTEIPMGPVDYMDPDGPQMVANYEASITEDAKQIAGVSIDSFILNMSMPEEMMNMGPEMAWVDAFTNYAGYFAATETSIISSTMQDDDFFATAITTATQGGGMTADDALASLHEGAAMVMLIDPNAIMQTAVLFEAIPPDQPELSIVGMSLATDGSSAGARVSVPFNTTRFVVETAGMMMGGF